MMGKFKNSTEVFITDKAGRTLERICRAFNTSGNKVVSLALEELSIYSLNMIERKLDKLEENHE